MMKQKITSIMIASALWVSAADAAVIVPLDSLQGPKTDVVRVWENTFGLGSKESFKAGQQQTFNPKAQLNPGLMVLTVNPTETQLKLQWYTGYKSDISIYNPTGSCATDISPWTIVVGIDNDVAATLTQSNYRLQTGFDGYCYFEATFPAPSGAAKIPPGLWSAVARINIATPVARTLSISACTPTQGKQPMYRARLAQYTDNFYTVSQSNRDIALSIGYQNRGVPFSMPSFAGSGSSGAFNRYYKGAPQYEHFYSANSAEGSYVLANGYVAEGIEGYVLKSAKPGAVALMRYALFNSADGDLQHYYTITPNDPEAAGWGYDGVIGYVCPP
jgi:hypothetical protein